MGTNQQLPTLIEVFDVIDNKTFLNIELKGSNTAKLSLEIVKQQINNNGFLKKNILFSSFNWKELKDLRKFNFLSICINIGIFFAGFRICLG